MVSPSHLLNPGRKKPFWNGKDKKLLYLRQTSFLLHTKPSFFSAVTLWTMHVPYFALINLNLKFHFCANVSHFSLNLFLIGLSSSRSLSLVLSLVSSFLNRRLTTLWTQGLYFLLALGVLSQSAKMLVPDSKFCSIFPRKYLKSYLDIWIFG